MTFVFFTSNAPNTPELISPSNDSTGAGAKTAFNWGASLNAVTYNIEVANDAGFNDIEVSQSGIEVSSYTISEDNALTDGSTYWWRVNAVNPDGVSPWSSAWKFKVGEVLLPEVPVLESPSNDSTTGILLTVFNWNIADRVETYRFQLATDTGFNNIKSDQSGLTTTVATYDATNGVYYWRVKASNIYGDSNWADYRKVTVNALLLPEVPVLESPGNLVTLYDDLSQEFVWNVSEKAETYELLIATDTGFNNIKSDQSGLTTTVATYDATAYTTYYWKVRATNSYGSSAYSAYRTLTLSNALDLTGLEMWFKWDEGLTMDGTTVRRWDSVNGASGWVGNPTKAQQPTIYGDGSIYFSESATQYLFENDNNGIISGDVFYSDYTKKWTCFCWVKNIAPVSSYSGFRGMNAYVYTGYREYTSGGGDFAVGVNMAVTAPPYDGVEVYTGAQQLVYANDFGQWHLMVASWDGVQAKFRMYKKDKSLLGNEAIRAITPFNYPYYGIILYPWGRICRYAIMFSRALSKEEMDKVFDMTIGDIP